MKKLKANRLNQFPEATEMAVVMEDHDTKKPKVVGYVQGIPFGAYEVEYDYDDCCSMYPPKPLRDVFMVFHGNDGEPFLIPRWKYYQCSITEVSRWLSEIR